MRGDDKRGDEEGWDWAPRQKWCWLGPSKGIPPGGRAPLFAEVPPFSSPIDPTYWLSTSQKSDKMAFLVYQKFEGKKRIELNGLSKKAHFIR